MRLITLAALAAAAVAHKGGKKLHKSHDKHDVEHETRHALKHAAKALKRAGRDWPVLNAVHDALFGGSEERSHQLRSQLAALGTGYGSTDSEFCSNNTAFQFFPAPVSVVSSSAPSATWQGDGCFTSMSASTAFDANGATVTLTGTGATSFLCSDYYLVASSFGVSLGSVGALGATTSIRFNYTGPDEIVDVSLNGLNIMVLPCGLLGTVTSVLNTVDLFNGTQTELQDRNINFLMDRGVWPAPAELFNVTVPIDTSAVQSGDYLAITRFDGLDPMIAFGTGGLTGHSAIAVWETDPATGIRTLYVCESTDKNPLGPVYFPPPYGLRRTVFSTWITLAQAAMYHVALLPLAPQSAAAFNETAYWQWFYSVQGMPYGYHTMLMSFLDTYSPFANLPLPINGPEIAVVMNMLDSVLGNATAGVTVYSMITWPLNQRLKSSCTTLRCALNMINANKKAGLHPASFAEAVAIPENDDWRYGPNVSLVCSEFAARGWKAGLAAAQPVWTQIQATEQTPKDNYQMGIYDTTGTRFTAAQCPGGVTTVAGSSGSYCQLMGTWRMYLSGYNSIPIYPGMNNACSAQWPTYVRGPAGC